MRFSTPLFLPPPMASSELTLTLTLLLTTPPPSYSLPIEPDTSRIPCAPPLRPCPQPRTEQGHLVKGCEFGMGQGLSPGDPGI